MWTSTYQRQQIYVYAFLYGGPLFIHQYSHMWIDFCGIQDAFARDLEFDKIFTRSTRAIFAFHDYLWLIHRLTYRRTNHHNIHDHGYKEGGAITTPFDMTVLNDLDCFQLVMDTIGRLPQTG